MKRNYIFTVFILFYLIVCFFHFRWEKYFDEDFAAAYDPYEVLASEIPTHIDNAMDYFDYGLKSSMTSEKIEYFTKALELDPELAAAYERRGMLYYFQEKYDKVIQDFNSYIELAPAKGEAYRMLGMGYLKSGMYRPAINNFTRAIEIKPEHVHAHAYRAEAYRLNGKYDEAIIDATRAIKLRGDLRAISDAYRTRAKVYQKIGRNELVNADIDAAWQVDPRVPIWWRELVMYASPEDMRRVAPIVVIVIAFVLIFGIRLKPPEKDE
ncbi:MAG: tetratricopeptide repeat protein [Deltaproteobacteria bacterium]|jgi:tetratricopeptide (TPR) repeat protein|nr:tetratricopeptide repeat protein [Deltaproteobacteria bacterium]